MKKILLLLFVVFAIGHAYAQIKIYRMPLSSEFKTSTTFNVDVFQNNAPFKSVNVFQYSVPENQKTKTENFAMFAFSRETGPITAKISMVNNSVLDSAKIEVVNKSIKGLKWWFADEALYVSIPRPKIQVLIRFKSDYANQLLLFADPYEERQIPSGANVKYFTYEGSPYLQNAAYDRYSVPNDIDVVYLEDGAVLKGTIHTSSGRTKPLTIMGSGIVIGNGKVVSGSGGIPYNAIEINDGNNHIIEGITCISSRHFSIRASKNAIITNIKMFGYNSNNDGIVAGDGSIIENCYSKVNDDHIKLYNNNMVVRNCTFYEQTNGAVFQFAWNNIVPGSNCLVEDCEIVAWEAGCGDPATGQGGIARSFINLRETAAGSTSSNNIFRNIYIQGQMPRFICVNGKYDSSKPVSLKNITLENIIVERKPTSYSWLYTGSPHELSFNFKNVKMGGVCLSESNYEFKTEGNVILNYLACGPEDLEPPTIPSGLKADTLFTNGVFISWQKSQDNIALQGYEVYADNILIAFSTNNHYKIVNLINGTTYELKVRAVDSSGNFSEYSSGIVVKTLSCSDNVPPTPPQKLTAINITDNSCQLSWNSSNDNVGVAGYEIYMDNVFLESAADTFLLVKNLSCSKNYEFKISAYDVCNNYSSETQTYSIKTADCPECKVTFQGGNGKEEGQIPYAIHYVPGIVEAEDFDIGGEGLAFHETDGRAVWAHPAYRNTEQTDIDEADGGDPNSGVVIGGIAEGEWAEYSINVKENGEYFVDIIYGANGEKNIYFKIDNQIWQCIQKLPSTGKASIYNNFKIDMPVFLSKGEHLFSWVSESSFAFNLDKFEFTAIIDAVISNKISEPEVLSKNVYHKGETLALHSGICAENWEYKILNLNGIVLKSGEMTQKFKINTPSIVGVYLFVIMNEEEIFTEKFVIQ